ncbi:MAG: chromosome segregation protein SMC, partial [Clostridium sp.]
YQYRVRIVTLEGELFHPGGSLSGGTFKNNSNLLGRRKEQEALEKEKQTIESAIASVKEEIQTAQKQVENFVKDANAKEETVKELELKKNTAQIKYEQAVSVKEQKEKEYRAIANDGKEIENQKALIEDSLSRIDSDLELSKQKEEQAKEQVKLLSVKLDEEREKQVELQEKISQNRLEVSSFQQKNNYVAENIHRIEESLHDLETEYNKLMQEQKNSDDTVSEMEQAIAGYEEKNKQLQEEIVRLTKEIEEESKQKEEMMASQKDIFEKRDALMNHMSELDKESFRLESRKQNIEEKMEAKVNHMWNEYELTYRSAKEIDIDHSISYTRMKANVTDTKNKIRGLGDVNVNAIEDFKSVSERYTLLKTQHDDLIESEDALKKIIADLDEEMRKQFTEKFADIQKQFDKVFRELFGGGKGTLELVEEEDVLEAGITINAQPPGKKLGNMMQLSGGEKALTAIALLFAIQNLKPSPFCLLDEIEAALDDSNVKRYAKYLHKLTKNTQFIVITHRKGTMEAADVLYGITMQEKGVSTLVSVKLIEEQLDN